MNLIISLFKKQLEYIDLLTLEYLLENNISFIEYFDAKMPPISLVKSSIKFFRVDISKINFSLILDCLEESNKEAYYLVLDHPNGKEWIQKTLKDLYEKYH
ncbi:MAG: hypothetical protein Q8O68_00480 [Candidatus Daviesbacteria bacterium]|nr:hypothetical protein [Candidatus Daviesbacteria bacterium]